MTSQTMIKRVLFIYIVAFALPAYAQDDSKMIFTRAVDQLMTDRMELSMDIEITDQKGRVKEKAYDILMAKFGEVELTRMVMQKPERAKGVTVVITNFPEKTGEIEVYTPANGKVRKMEATPENMERVGSNITVSSYASQDLDDLDFAPADKQEVDGKSCYTFRVSNRADQAGMKAEFLVEESTYHIVQIRFFDEQGNNTNITSLSDYQAVPGVKGKIQPMQIEVKDFVENTQTLIQIQQVSHRPDLKEADFVLQENSL
jgi:outer membrane lipoprotein-sorting protein